MYFQLVLLGAIIGAFCGAGVAIAIKAHERNQPKVDRKQTDAEILAQWPGVGRPTRVARGKDYMLTFEEKHAKYGDAVYQIIFMH